MAGKILRGAIVGASSLLGKELADELNAPEGAVWELTLLDAAETGGVDGGLGGQITAAGDEAMVILPVSNEAFAGMDIVFFAAEVATTAKYWKAAQAAGASIVDMTGALEDLPGAEVRSPWVHAGRTAGPVFDLATVAVVLGHPAAVMLAVAAERLQGAFGLERMAATVMEPASQQGGVGVDEMHQQTVSLLSFKPVIKDVYDTQVAFTLRAALGGAAKVDLVGVGEEIESEVRSLAGDEARYVTVQMVQAPVFHGTAVSVFVELAAEAEVDAVRAALEDGLLVAGEEAPSNESVAGKREMEFIVRSAGGEGGTAFWLWMAADNLRLTARHAAACAVELAGLRPGAGVN